MTRTLRSKSSIPVCGSPRSVSQAAKPQDASGDSSWSDMTVKELKKELRARSLPVSGLKASLIERLENAPATPASAAVGIEDAVPATPRKRTPRRIVTPEEEATLGRVVTPEEGAKKAKRKPPAATKSPRKRPKIEPGSLPPPEEGWEDIYNLVEELRKDRTAPVDHDGAEQLPEKNKGEKVYRFQVLVALMLSSQTKDAVVGMTMRKLQQAGAGLTVENIHSMDPQTLNELLHSVGFHNNKTVFIKAAAETLIEKYQGDIPPTADEMMELKGVGPKMAYIVEQIAFGRQTGIGVDVHMHKNFNKLNWVNSKTPEQTRVQLEGWLPREKWSDVNVLWVGFGQEVQQQKGKLLRKIMTCSNPLGAMKLVKRLGFDVKKEAKKIGMEEEVASIMKQN